MDEWNGETEEKTNEKTIFVKKKKRSGRNKKTARHTTHTRTLMPIPILRQAGERSEVVKLKKIHEKKTLQSMYVEPRVKSTRFKYEHTHTQKYSTEKRQK